MKKKFLNGQIKKQYVKKGFWTVKLKKQYLKKSQNFGNKSRKTGKFQNAMFYNIFFKQMG